MLTHNFPKPHELSILNIEVYVQWFPVGTYFELLDRVHHKMKLEAAFKGILKILENLKISLKVNAKSLKMSVKEFNSVRSQTSCEQLH